MQFTNTFTAANAPSNVRVQREGDGSSMIVTWDLLSPVEARGFLEFYQVAYMQSTTQRKRQVTTCLQAPAVCMQSPCQVCPNQSMVTIGRLNESAAYSVTVAARNGAGLGTVSEPVSSLREFQTSEWETREWIVETYVLLKSYVTVCCNGKRRIDLSWQ